MVNNRINPDDVPPRRNLPDEAEQWGRWMEDDQNLLKGAVISQGQSLQGLNRSTAASLANISDQLTAIADAQAELQAQQVILSEQQSELSDAQSDITDLLGRVVTTRVATGQSSNYPVTTTSTTRASANIPVPSGYNRAAVTATASSVAEVNAPSGNDFLQLVVRIAGQDGTPISAEGTGLYLGSEFPNVTTTHARVINNPSGTISVQGRIRSFGGTWPSSPANGTVITATATFYNE